MHYSWYIHLYSIGYTNDWRQKTLQNTMTTCPWNPGAGRMPGPESRESRSTWLHSLVALTSATSWKPVAARRTTSRPHTIAMSECGSRSEINQEDLSLSLHLIRLLFGSRWLQCVMSAQVIFKKCISIMSVKMGVLNIPSIVQNTSFSKKLWIKIYDYSSWEINFIWMGSHFLLKWIS